MAFFDKLKTAIGLEEDYEDEWDDEEYENEKEIYEEESVVPVEENYASTRRRDLGSMMNLQQGAYGKVQIAIHEPMAYEDGPKVLNDVKAKKIVLLNFEMLETEKKKQVFEFVNGGIYSLEAQIQKVTKDLFVIAPKGIFIEGKTSMDRFAEPSTFNFSQQ